MATTITKTCEVCGKVCEVYPSKIGTFRFCSRECQRKTFQEKVILTCARCGKQYEEFQSRKDRSKFCSKHCHAKHYGWRQTMDATETRQCKICDTSFETTRHHGGKVTCSKECANQARGESSRRKDSKIDIPCQQCGKLFRVFPCRTRAYCSQKCATTAKEGTFRTSQVVPCTHCGQDVVKFKCRISAYDRHFCNSECYHAWDSIYKSTPEMVEKLRFNLLNTNLTSKIEDTVAGWLDSHNIVYERQFPIWYFIADFKIGNTILEVNGCYWHACEKCQLSPSQNPDRAKRDKMLKMYCQSNRYIFMEIWEHDIRKGVFDALLPLLDD